MRFFLTVAAALLFVACNREKDIAPELHYAGQANMTIAELLEYHTVGSYDSFDSIPAGTVITGIVTSSDQHGNCYKWMTIQDGTGAIKIKIDDSSLYPKYRIGQRVYVECGNMVIGDYRKEVQIGYWIDGAMAGISSSQEDLYIFRDGIPGAEPEPIIINSADDITDATYGHLVKIVNCSIKNGGIATFSEPNANTDRIIVMSDHSELVMRNSSYADFAQEIMPSGDGVIYGVLGRYNATPQLYLRSAEDVQFIRTESLPAFIPDENSIGAGGWTVVNEEGWGYWTNHNSFKIYNPNVSPINSWLVSPTFSNLQNRTGVYFTLSQETDGTAVRAVKYTTQYDPAHPTDGWTDYTLGEVIPAEVTSNPNFRIAFQFNGGNGAWWQIKGINFYARVQ